MPVYKLKIGGTDSGKLQVSQANSVTTWSYQAEGGNGFNNLATQPTCSGNPMQPSAGDSLNISLCTTIPNTPQNAATYRAQSGSQRAGYYYAAPASIKETSPADWDAQDSSAPVA